MSLAIASCSLGREGEGREEDDLLQRVYQSISAYHYSGDLLSQKILPLK